MGNYTEPTNVRARRSYGSEPWPTWGKDGCDRIWNEPPRDMWPLQMQLSQPATSRSFDPRCHSNRFDLWSLSPPNHPMGSHGTVPWKKGDHDDDGASPVPTNVWGKYKDLWGAIPDLQFFQIKISCPVIFENTLSQAAIKEKTCLLRPFRKSGAVPWDTCRVWGDRALIWGWPYLWRCERLGLYIADMFSKAQLRTAQQNGTLSLQQCGFVTPWGWDPFLDWGRI